MVLVNLRVACTVTVGVELYLNHTIRNEKEVKP